MSDEESIGRIISRIQQVHLQEERIDQEEDRLRVERSNIRREQRRLLEKLRSKRHLEDSRATATSSRGRRSSRTAQKSSDELIRSLCRFNIGDRVYITNKITVPKFRGENEGDRKATVTSILHDRTNADKSIVYIKTDNGFETRRNVEYLRHQYPQR